MTKKYYRHGLCLLVTVCKSVTENPSRINKFLVVYAHCFHICSLFSYMVIMFIYGLNICSLLSYMPTVWLKYMLTAFIYAHCFHVSYMLTVFIYTHCYMLTIFIYAHCFYMISSLFCLASSPLLYYYFYFSYSSLFGSSCYFFGNQQQIFNLANSHLLAPLLPMMKLSNSIIWNMS
jgi:hypothetical protein